MRRFSFSTAPQEYKALIKSSLRLYAQSFTVKTIVLALLFALVVFLPRLISIFSHYNLLNISSSLDVEQLWIILINLVGTIFYIGLVWHIYCVARHIYEPFIQDIYIGTRKVLIAFVASVLINLVLGITVLFIIAFQHLFVSKMLMFFANIISILLLAIFSIGQFLLILYIVMSLNFFLPLIALENKNVLSSLVKSAALAWNHWWRVLTVQLTPWLCFLLILMLMERFLHIHFHFYLLNSSIDLNATIINIILYALFAPWVVCLLIIQLKDLELRHKIKPPKSKRRKFRSRSKK